MRQFSETRVISHVVKMDPRHYFHVPLVSGSHCSVSASPEEDVQHGKIESQREQVRLQDESSMKEKVLRDTQIRSMHEMGEMKRTQELQVDGDLVQKKNKS